MPCLALLCCLSPRAAETNALHGAVVRLEQRETAWLPEGGRALRLTLGDITRGRVTASLADADGRPVLAPVALRPGSAALFTLGGGTLALVCHRLENDLIGDDEGVFTLRADAESVAALRANPRALAGRLSDPLDRLDRLDLLALRPPDAAVRAAFQERLATWRAGQPRRLLTADECAAFWRATAAAEPWLRAGLTRPDGSALPLEEYLARERGDAMLAPDAFSSPNGPDVFAGDAARMPAPPAAIAELLARISGSGLEFVREGETHPGPAAARHLRYKWVSAGADIADPGVFIDRLATRSSLTGNPYLVRFPDQSTRPLADWLREPPPAATSGSGR